ncbi:uncharacterized protein LOC122511930 [Leptopilina heterotoma]|uniref:uncharacterized protein LOC122511930 n=1 Tax=Leptopilina heterotoma TaxID=63436 RepID=UPI001CA7C14C|nr:uncharacterized protein LOC122511930 [Leptopilina heterotoma]
MLESLDSENIQEKKRKEEKSLKVETSKQATNKKILQTNDEQSQLNLKCVTILQAMKILLTTTLNPNHASHQMLKGEITFKMPMCTHECYSRETDIVRRTFVFWAKFFPT